MLEFDAQCCDAHLYINLARACLAGECYDPVRPAGVQYWFSLPLRVGLPLEYVMVANWVLLFISVTLAVFAVRAVLRKINGAVGLGATAIILFVATASHIFFFWPFMHVFLADAPAGLMATIGIFSYLLGSNSQRWPAAAWWVLAGIGLGMSVWIRSFYLYPVVILLGIHTLFWLLNGRRRAVDILVLVALIPILIQFNMTWQRHHQWSFIEPVASKTWKSIHLSDSGIGYDTLLPFSAYRIFPKCEFIPGGVKAAWDNKSFKTLWCYTSRRIAYYWGSDTRQAYMIMKSGTNLFPYGEQLDTLPIWSADGVRVIADDAIAPDGNRTADKLIFPEELNHTRDGLKRMTIGFMPTWVGPHTLSIWLWSPVEKRVILRWRHASSNEVLKELPIVLTAEPTRYSLTADFPMEYYLLHLVSEGQQAEQMGSATSDYFYAWGLQLERGAIMTPYTFNDDPAHYRLWSAWLLLANLTALLLALILIKPIVQYRNTSLLLTLGFIGLTFGEALLILPEQRFVVATNTVLWSLAVLSFIWLCRLRQQQSPSDGAK